MGGSAWFRSTASLVLDHCAALLERALEAPPPFDLSTSVWATQLIRVLFAGSEAAAVTATATASDSSSLTGLPMTRRLRILSSALAEAHPVELRATAAAAAVGMGRREPTEFRASLAEIGADSARRLEAGMRQHLSNGFAVHAEAASGGREAASEERGRVDGGGLTGALGAASGGGVGGGGAGEGGERSSGAPSSAPRPLAGPGKKLTFDTSKFKGSGRVGGGLAPPPASTLPSIAAAVAEEVEKRVVREKEGEGGDEAV